MMARIALGGLFWLVFGAVLGVALGKMLKGPE